MSVIIDRKTIIGPTESTSLTLIWDDIANIPASITNPYNVTEWNIFFGLPPYDPPYGEAFTSVEILGNNVILKGGRNIIIYPALFFSQPYSLHIIGIIDNGCIIETQFGAFASCYNLTTFISSTLQILGNSSFLMSAPPSSLTTFSAPALITAGESCFDGNFPLITTINFPSLQTAGTLCFSGNFPLVTTINLPSLQTTGPYSLSVNSNNLTTINLPSLVAPNGLGGDPGWNNVFTGINNQTITLTIPLAFQTNVNGNHEDVDIYFLGQNNTLTVNWV